MQLSCLPFLKHASEPGKSTAYRATRELALTDSSLSAPLEQENGGRGALPRSSQRPPLQNECRNKLWFTRWHTVTTVLAMQESSPGSQENQESRAEPTTGPPPGGEGTNAHQPVPVPAPAGTDTQLRCGCSSHTATARSAVWVDTGMSVAPRRGQRHRPGTTPELANGPLDLA